MKSKSNSKKYNSGFTLVELIVTVSVVAILSSIAAPSFRTMLQNNKASVAANEMVSALLLARSEALKRRNNVTVCTSADQTTCAGNSEKDFAKGWIVFVDCDKDRVVGSSVDCGNAAPEAEKVVKAGLGTPGMNINKGGASVNAHYFTYNFTGRTDVAASFSITSDNSTTVLKEVAVSLTGRVKTCDGACP